MAAGGDGTISEVVQGIGPDAGDTELGMLPLGTGNGRYAGHGFAAAPEALMDDGRLDLLIARAAAMPKLLTLLPDVIRRDEPDSELIGSWRCRSVELTLAPPMAVSLDGEIEETAGLVCRVRRGALRVIVSGRIGAGVGERTGSGSGAGSGAGGGIGGG